SNAATTVRPSTGSNKEIRATLCCHRGSPRIHEELLPHSPDSLSTGDREVYFGFQRIRTGIWLLIYATRGKFGLTALCLYASCKAFLNRSGIVSCSIIPIMPA